MFKEIVEVTNIQGDKVKVKFAKKKMCGCCRYTFLCGVSKGGNATEGVVLDNVESLNLQQGDRVEVGIEEKKNFLAVLILFGGPLAVFILMLLLFRSRGELASFLLALTGVFVYYVAVKGIMKSKGKYFNLKILRKVYE